ncbi:MAG TPA: MBL fold metallo-hydrolase [Acidimicrobiia bacterium]|nr:MBL fold metallo-hydrolase [Acidimicrobiia bacterium]
MDNLQWQIGDVRITRVVEMLTPVPPDGLIPTLTAEEIERNASWLKPNFMDDDGNLVLSIHALCVESQGRKIVVDTCIGNDRVIPAFGGLTLDTPFLEDLAAAGFAREDVDTVICTHLHFDHVGWNTMLVDGKWVPTFPNARYVICRGEWEHWSTASTEETYAATLDDAVRPVVDAGLADFVEPDHRVTDDIRLEPTPGHTPGHVAVHVESGGQHAFITGDLVHHPIQWAEPARSSAPDTDPAQSTATRRRLLGEFADTDVLVIGTHFAPPCSGHLVSTGDGYRFEPTSAV